MEIFDLYTPTRQPTCRTMRRGEPTPDGYYRLVIHVCIFNDRGEMLIQQRQPFKKQWSGMWDLTVGGCVVSGETTQEAARREVWEELGVELEIPPAPAFSCCFPGGFDDYFLVDRELDISQLRLQAEEVQAAKWACVEEVCAMIDRGEFIPYQKAFLEFLFYRKADNSRGSIYR